MAKRKGLDFAWSKPSVPAIQAGGYTFVCRYHSYDTTGKNLTKAEADSYKAAGIAIVSNWEYATDAALNGFNQGARDATNAQAQLLSCGGDPTAPIYFSVDFDATEAQQAPINAYLQGIASVIGLGRTGMYSGFWPMKRAFDAGVMTWGWQTYAWSGGNWDPRAQLRQVLNGVNVGGADCDVDESQVDNFGQWYAGAPPVWNEDEDMPTLVRAADGGVYLVTMTNYGQVYQHLTTPEAVTAWTAQGCKQTQLPDNDMSRFGLEVATAYAVAVDTLIKAQKAAGCCGGSNGGGPLVVELTGTATPGSQP